MTGDEVIHAAIEAGMTCYGCKSEKLGHSWHSYTDNIERFAELVAAKEREACSDIAESFIVDNDLGERGGNEVASGIYDAILARKP